LENKGLLILCLTEKMLEEELRLSQIASEEGLDVNELSTSEINTMEPNVALNAIGAVHYQCDWHMTPHEFMKEMYDWLKMKNVIFYKNEQVVDIQASDRVIKKIITSNDSFTGDEFVLAAGSWSNLLSRKLGIRILLEAGKGYRINVDKHTGITIPTVLAEAKVAVTPMNGFTRFAGTMEIAGVNHKINRVRVDAIAEAAHKYYPDISISNDEKENAACGLRAISPDGKPYIGKSSKCNNLIIATGHAMMGWSMAPATGKLVAEIISEEKPSFDIDPFSPDRRF